MAEKNNVVKFHRQIHLNIAIIISFIIFIYILFHVFTYLTTENISIYEVKQGTIAAKDNYSALAIREEELYTAAEDGYIYYFAPAASRVGARTMLYAIDKDGKVISELKDDSKDISNLDNVNVASLEADISGFMTDFEDRDFYRIYGFKSNLSDSLRQLYNEENLRSHSDVIEKAVANNTFFSYYAPRPGLVVYTVDGYEDVTLANFSSSDFDVNGLTINDLRKSDSVKYGETAYKLVTSDDWNLVMPIDSELSDQLKDTSAIEVEFNEDGTSTWCACEITQRAGQPYLILSLDDSMERYCEERFVNINLKLDEKNGLKLPNSAIIEKTFFTVPKKYFTRGEDSKNWGLLIKEGGSVEFRSVTIYNESNTAYYVDANDVSEGDVVAMVNSKETYTIGNDVDRLLGVYNVNKGYAVFKQIEIIYQNNDYTIVKTGTDYGLALYDRIVLQGDKVKENEIIN